MSKINIPQADSRQHDISHFDKPELTAEAVNHNPFAFFQQWYQDAQKTEMSDPNAMSLATVGAHNMPDVRIVLLKDFTDAGFIFFTNYNSQKGQDLQHNPNASLCFHWKTQLRQVRIQGIVRKISSEESDHYFATRHVNSQIGAYVSQQSQDVSGRQALLDQLTHYQNQFKDQAEIQRPEYWGGYVLEPLRIEYWQNGSFRLHDRLVFFREGLKAHWHSKKIYP